MQQPSSEKPDTSRDAKHEKQDTWWFLTKPGDDKACRNGRHQLRQLGVESLSTLLDAARHEAPLPSGSGAARATPSDAVRRVDVNRWCREIVGHGVLVDWDAVLVSGLIEIGAPAECSTRTEWVRMLPAEGGEAGEAGYTLASGSPSGSHATDMGRSVEGAADVVIGSVPSSPVLGGGSTVGKASPGGDSDRALGNSPSPPGHGRGEIYFRICAFQMMSL